MAPNKVVDATQRAEGDAGDWVNEPLKERHADMIVHTERPFNAEPPYYALRHMITPKTLHYRRQHTPVPVVDKDTYRVKVGFEGADPLKAFSMKELQGGAFKELEIAVTFMCTGNRRSEFNNEKDGETMGLPWRNGSISTARWKGCSFREVLKAAGVDIDAAEDAGYRFLTFYGIEDYHVSVPLSKGFDKHGDVILAWQMNGEELPRDHGYPLRVIVPGFVGARSVKWLDRIILMKNECQGMHQTGIAYKQLGPNIKKLVGVSKEYIEAVPPIDHVPITSAITLPEVGTKAAVGSDLKIQGYAYSGTGSAVIRVDISLDGGDTWQQAEIERADATQQMRSGKAWAWVQWRLDIKVPDKKDFTIVCKAVDDNMNQQPHETSGIWNIRGILNTSWGRCKVVTQPAGLIITEEALSGDNTVENVGIRMSAKFGCTDCRQKFDTEDARKLHWRFIHDPNRHQED